MPIQFIYGLTSFVQLSLAWPFINVKSINKGVTNNFRGFVGGDFQINLRFEFEDKEYDYTGNLVINVQLNNGYPKEE